MKVLSEHKASLEDCLETSQREGVVITRQGKPFALIVGVQGMDMEQIELGQSDKFWRLIEQRRAQKKITREELEASLGNKRKRKARVR